MERVIIKMIVKVKMRKVTSKKRTFADYSTYVLKLKSFSGVKIRTIERYESLLERINPYLGQLKLSEITPQILNEFYQILGKSGARLNKKKVKIKSDFDFKQWLKNNSTSITGFSKIAGISPSTLSSAIKGKLITYEKAKMIVEAMKYDFNDIFEMDINNTPLSNKTILEHHRVISTILAQAEKEMLISYNPAALATPPKPQKTKPIYYQPKEMLDILKALNEAPLKWKTITYMLIDTGCRRGEIMGLKWESVDLNDGIITIERSLLYSSQKGVFESTTKNDVDRVLRISSETILLLKKWKKEQDKLKKNSDDWIDTGYVFTTNNGDRMNPDSITDWLDKFSKANNLPHVHPHAFRHTAASTMIANGIDIVTVANELGHTNPMTTATIYAHQIQLAKARAQGARGSIFDRFNIT